MGILDVPVLNVVPRITGFSPALVGGVSTISFPSVLGSSAPFSKISLYINGSVVATGFADITGAWAISIPAQLNGTFSLIARAEPASALTALVINDPKQPLQNIAGVPAVFEMDNERALFFTNNVPYADVTSLVAAIGGALTGSSIAAGGYVESTAVTVLTNGTFDTVTTGWTASGTGAVAIASGEIQLTISTSLDSFSQTVTGYPGRAFAFTGTGRRGTNTVNSPQLAATTQNAALNGNFTSGSPIIGVNATTKLHLSAPNSGAMYVGARGSTGLGTALFDNFTLVEAMPFTGWNELAVNAGSAGTSFSVLVDAVTPATLPTLGEVAVIWQGDTDDRSSGAPRATQRDSIRVHWAADGTVHFIARLNNTQLFDFTLGSVAVGSRFRVAFGASLGINSDMNAGYAASLNGANVLIQSTATTSMVGVSHMRVGQDSGGLSPWVGTFNRVAVVRGRQANDWLEFYATLPAVASRVFAGDSYIGGAGGVKLPDLYETATGIVTYNTGVGGVTLQQIVSQITSRPYLRPLRLVVWDGSNNGMVDIASQVNTAKEIWAFKGNTKTLFIPSIAVPNPGTVSSAALSSTAVYLAAYRDALIVAFGAAAVFDPVPVLQALATATVDDTNDVAAGLIPRSTLLTQNAGEVHLSSAAMTAIAQNATFQNKIAAL